MVRRLIQKLLIAAIAAQSFGSATLPAAACMAGADACQCSVAAKSSAGCCCASERDVSCCGSVESPSDCCHATTLDVTVEKVRICNCGCSDPSTPVPATSEPGSKELQLRFHSSRTSIRDAVVDRHFSTRSLHPSLGSCGGTSPQQLLCLWLI